jgi:hypothetical protein
MPGSRHQIAAGILVETVCYFTSLISVCEAEVNQILKTGLLAENVCVDSMLAIEK